MASPVASRRHRRSAAPVARLSESSHHGSESRATEGRQACARSARGRAGRYRIGYNRPARFQTSGPVEFASMPVDPRMARRWLLLCFALIAGSAGGGCSTPQRPSVSIAAASDLSFALEEILTSFRQAHPRIDVRVAYGSSGNFYTQISQGAPFDMYLSADADYPRRLIEAGAARPGSLFEYGRGRIVLWARNESPLDVSRGVAVFGDERLRRLAIPHPRHAPYGRAAVAALTSLGVYEQLRERFVIGESAAQAAQFAEAGGADAGILPHALASAPPLSQAGRTWLIPAESHPPLIQCGVVLERARDRAAAEEVQRFLLGPEGSGVLARFGITAAEE